MFWKKETLPFTNEEIIEIIKENKSMSRRISKLKSIGKFKQKRTFKKSKSTCSYCGEVYTKTHHRRKYCPEKFGVYGYCFKEYEKMSNSLKK